MRKITPFLWFEHQAEEAMKFYISIFKNSKVINVSRAGKAVISVTFELDGQQFMALNAGPQFKFNEAVSFYVDCETQEEVDQFWKKLSAGGQEGRCGWLKDKFGLSWQVVPSVLGRMLNDPDTARSRRVTEAMMRMNKIDIAGLQAAYKQQSV